MDKQKEKEDCRKDIIKMLEEIEDLEGLKMIRGMTRAVHRNNKKAEEG